MCSIAKESMGLLTLALHFVFLFEPAATVCVAHDGHCENDGPDNGIPAFIQKKKEELRTLRVSRKEAPDNTALSLGMVSRCVIDGGQMKCSGKDGFPWGDDSSRHTIQIPPCEQFTAVGGHAYFTCGVRAAGDVMCSPGTSSSPDWSVSPAAYGSSFVETTAGWYFKCGIRSDRSGVCWGSEGYFPTENGAPKSWVDRAGPFVKMTGGTEWVCGLKEDQVIECWGQVNQIINRVAPNDLTLTEDNGDGATGLVVFPGTWLDVSMGSYNLCAVDTSYSIKCFGRNDNLLQDSIPSGEFTSVSLSYQARACAVKLSDGTLECWGQTSVTPPATAFTSIQMGDGADAAFGCGFTVSDGSVECFGDNTYGQTDEPVGPSASDISAANCPPTPPPPLATCSTITCAATHVADSSASAISCAGATCDNTGPDNEMCCNAKAACSTITCADTHVLDSSALTAGLACAGETCDNTGPDNDYCCNPKALCSTITCGSANIADLAAATDSCENEACDNSAGSVDLERCCNPKAACSTITCAEGTIADSTAVSELCAGETCNNAAADNELCCNIEPATPCVGASCIIWGEPHVISFDLQQHHLKKHPLRESFFRAHEWKIDQQNVYERGTFWLVRSKNIHIQGEYKASTFNSSWTNLYTVAMSGPFLNNNTLIIRPGEAASTWNGYEILPTLGTSFDDHSGLVSAKYHKNSRTVQDGSWSPGIDINLPMGVKLTINRWKDSLNAEITMCKQEGGQDGQCGNFNGDYEDDIIAGGKVTR